MNYEFLINRSDLCFEKKKKNFIQENDLIVEQENNYFYHTIYFKNLN